MATSVDNRVTILNVIMLPSLLFTAAVFELPPWAATQLRIMQKQFLWRHTTSVEASRHKLNPGLLYTLRGAGKVGLVSINIAIKTQQVKHAVQWLTQKKDVYFPAWRSWAFRQWKSDWGTTISPRELPKRTAQRIHGTPGTSLHLLLGEWIKPDHEAAQAAMQFVDQHMNLALTTARSWMEDESWELRLDTKLPQPAVSWTDEGRQFWPTYQWNDNPWIRDGKGSMLKSSTYDRIRPCSIADLHIQRTGVASYSMIIPISGDGQKQHSEAKLRRWGIAVLMGSPPLDIAEEMRIQPDITMRRAPELEQQYKWAIAPDATVVGTAIDEDTATIELEQMPDGLHWSVKQATETNSKTIADAATLRKIQQRSGIVFNAHPYAHHFPWSVSDGVANKHVVLALKRQPFQRYKGSTRPGLKPVVDRLGSIAAQEPWQNRVMKQTPKQLWEHSNSLTAYQVWVSYRLAVRQLNLYFDGRQHNNGCRKLECCNSKKETYAHIFWECPCAQACWQTLICQWTGQSWTTSQVTRFIVNCAARRAPPVSDTMKKRLRARFVDEAEHYVEEWKRIWPILSSVCATTLWIQRNRVVHRGETVTLTGSVQEFWTTGIRQLRAVGKRESRRAHTRLQGTRLLQCIDLLSRKPKESPPEVGSHVQPPGPNATPALISWLRKFQTSCIANT